MKWPATRYDAYEKIVLKALPYLRFGSLRVTFPDKSVHEFTGAEPGPKADITLNNKSALKALLLRGDNGWGESYIEGGWDSDDLAAFMACVCLNVHICEQFYHGNPFFRFVSYIAHKLRPNTRSNSRKHIHAHYDLGNEFYKLWLDDTMTYSSALYDKPGQSLEEAQNSKYDRLLSKIKDAKHVLEIGCGWGGFAERAAQKHVKVTGLTLSPSQAQFAEERLKAKGLDSDVIIKDYRDVKGLFDHIVSIEMFEAVGEQFWGSYFTTLKDRLKQGGKALIQTITIADDVFPEYRKRGDFIQHYIFPGGMLASKTVFAEEVAKVGMRVEEAFSFGKDYAVTLVEWLKRFDAKEAEVEGLGYSPEFIRKWRFYLAYCAGAFASGRTDVVQYELVHA